MYAAQYAARARRLAVFTSILMIVPAASVFAPSARADGATLVVDPSGTTGFSTITLALAAASNGDTIVVRPGTYTDASYTIAKSVTLCSTGAGGSTCAPNAATALLTTNAIYPVFITADDVTLDGFTVDNAAFKTVDQDFGAIDPSLVVLYGGKRTQILDDVLQHVAAPLAAGQSRWHQAGVNIAPGSDDANIAHNTIKNLGNAAGPDGTCTNLPCSTAAVSDWGDSARLTVSNNKINTAGDGLSYGITLGASPGVTVSGNTIDVAGQTPGGPPTSVGIRAGDSGTGPSVGTTIFANTIETAPGELADSPYGVYGYFESSNFSQNAFNALQEALFLRSDTVGGNLVKANTFTGNVEGLLNYAAGTRILQNGFTGAVNAVALGGNASVDGGSSVGALLRDNSFSGDQYALDIRPSVSDLAVDAEHNAWGKTTRADIRGLIHDEGTRDSVDVNCFIDPTSGNAICPPTADFTTSSGELVKNRVLQFTDASVSGGRAINAWSWSATDGWSSTSQDPTHKFTSAGSFDVSLTVTDAEGYTATATHTLVIAATGALDHVSFTTAPTSTPADTPVTFVATPYDAYGNALVDSVAYSVSTGSGSVNPAGLFTPNLVGTSVISATDGAKSATASISVTVGGLDHVLFTSAPTSVAADKSATFAAKAYDKNGNARADAVTFSVASGSGSIGAASGVFSPNQVGATLVEAAAGAKTATSAITVTVGALDHVTFTAAPATTDADHSVIFAALPYDVKGNLRADPVSYSIDDGSGLIDATDGQFYPFYVGTTTVRASAGGAHATSLITVTPGALDHIKIANAPLTVNVNEPAQLSVLAFDKNGNARASAPAVTWATTSGSVSAAGVLKLASAGSATLTATTADGKTATGSATAITELSSTANGDRPTYTLLVAFEYGGKVIVHVDFADGAHVAGAAVTLFVTPDATGATGAETFSGTTDSNGNVAFTMTRELMLPGTYHLKATSSWDVNHGTAIGAYTVTDTPF
ncbi:MAG: PKD domain-containing protein [Thermoplasmatota archaeon]